MNFKNLHKGKQPLVIANVWDVASAKLAEKLNFKAIGTSSAAIASVLGYRDGEEMDFSELLFMVQRIAVNSKLPISVDLESGYGQNPDEIVENIKALLEVGIVGINLEDSRVEQERKLVDAAEFAQNISEIKGQLSNIGKEIFLNIRTDCFLLNIPNALEEAQKRIKMYVNAGADGIFVPGIILEKDIKAVAESTDKPINVMCMPDLPDFDVLHNLGVKRISMGNFIFEHALGQMENTTSEILSQQSFKLIFQC